MTAPGARTPVLTWALGTPRNVAGAIACVQLRAASADGMDAFVRTHGLAGPVGRPVLRSLLGIDEGLAVRWDGVTLDLFPHAGPAIVRGLVARLGELGIGSSGNFVYPEASGEIEARVLSALATAPSSLAVDLLLAQPERWRARTEGERLADGTVLGRLLRPPLVAAVGDSNIGKSTLLNALAGRALAIVADAPGTTRDHVGALLDLGGLAVRYLDTPGRMAGAGGVDREAFARASGVAAGADLLLACGEPGREPAEHAGPGVLRVCLRGDLGDPGWRADAVVCAPEGDGVGALVGLIRERLVPQAALDDTAPWRFWADPA